MELFINGVKKNVWPAVTDMKGRLLLGKFIGTVVEAVDSYTDYDGSTEYIEEYYLAYQLLNGPIVAVEFNIDDLTEQNRIPVHSLAKKMFYIQEGFYPIEFPEEWQYIKPAPKTDAFCSVELDNLPI